MKGIIFDWVGTLYGRNEGLFDSSLRVLSELKAEGYKLGLVSLAREGVCERIVELKSSGVVSLFDSVVVDTSKTVESYRLCMGEMGTIPGTTAIVDDRVERGIKIGNELGCSTYWIQRGEYENEVPNEETGEPTYRIDSVEDLLDYVKRGKL